jgi:hypothetical protein
MSVMVINSGEIITKKDTIKKLLINNQQTKKKKKKKNEDRITFFFCPFSFIHFYIFVKQPYFKRDTKQQHE